MAGNWQSIFVPQMGAQQVSLRPQCLEDEQQMNRIAQNMQGQFWGPPSTAAKQQSAQNMQGQTFWDDQAVSCQEQSLENGISLYPGSFVGSRDAHIAEQAQNSFENAQPLRHVRGQDAGARPPDLVNMQNLFSGLPGQAEPSTEKTTVSAFLQSQYAPGNQIEMRPFTPQQPQETGFEGELPVESPQVGAFSEGPSPLISQEKGGPELLSGTRNVQMPIGGAQGRSGEMQVNPSVYSVLKKEAKSIQQGSELSPLAVQLSRFIMSGYERTPPGETPPVGRPSAHPVLQLPPQAAGFGSLSPKQDFEPFYQRAGPRGDSSPMPGEEKANAEEQILNGQDLSSHSPRHVFTCGKSEGGHFANGQDLSGQAFLVNADARFASESFPGEQSQDADVSMLQPPGMTAKRRTG